jgi:hypothetical protein
MKFRSGRVARRAALTVLLCLVPFTTTACFGSFWLTRRVYRFNQTVSPDKWIQWIVFLGLAFIPVYLFAGAIDVIFGNSVEFWTGKNPIAANETRTFEGPNGAVMHARHVPGGVHLELIDPAGATHELTILREAAGAAAYDADGILLGRVIDVAGHPQLISAAHPPRSN